MHQTLAGPPLCAKSQLNTAMVVRGETLKHNALPRRKTPSDVDNRADAIQRDPRLRCRQRAFIGINSKTDIAPELAVIGRVRSTSTRGNQWSIDLKPPKFLKDPVAAEIAWVHK
jgi:hypothetical protein